MKMMRNYQGQKGQALLIILLVMAVGLTIGLAVVSRSVTDIGISRQEEESSRVFSVAEAGIEEALKLGGIPPDVVIGDIRATVTTNNLGGTNVFVFPGKYRAGDTQTFWLVAHDSNGNLTETGRYTGTTIDFYWGNENQDPDSSAPALEVLLIYKEGSNFKIKRGAFDPNTSRANGFSSAEVGSYSLGDKTFRFRAERFNLPGTPYVLRLKLLYNTQEQILGIRGTANFPTQGVCYESTATAQQSGITRKVRQCQFYNAPPAIFDYVLFSGGDLVK